MRTILAAVALLSAIAVMADAGAAPISKAIVTAVDDVGKTFNCRWRSRDWTFQTTRTTEFFVGPKPAGFSDLKVGQTVKVVFHRNGRNRTADRVVITAK